MISQRATTSLTSVLSTLWPPFQMCGSKSKSIEFSKGIQKWGFWPVSQVVNMPSSKESVPSGWIIMCTRTFAWSVQISDPQSLISLSGSFPVDCFPACWVLVLQKVPSLISVYPVVVSFLTCSPFLLLEINLSFHRWTARLFRTH